MSMPTDSLHATMTASNLFKVAGTKHVRKCLEKKAIK